MIYGSLFSGIGGFDMDATKITGQARVRDFIVGRYQAERGRLSEFLFKHKSTDGTRKTFAQGKEGVPTLCTGRSGYSFIETYIYEEGVIRLVDTEEREALAGFPPGWSAGFTERIRREFYGNAVVPGCAEWIGRRIIEYEDQNKTRKAVKETALL